MIKYDENEKYNPEFVHLAIYDLFEIRVQWEKLEISNKKHTHTFVFILYTNVDGRKTCILTSLNKEKDPW